MYHFKFFLLEKNSNKEKNHGLYYWKSQKNTKYRTEFFSPNLWNEQK